MISVQNRQLRLNGNRYYFLVFSLLFLFLISCNPAKKTQQSQNTKTGSEVGPSKPTKIDTIVWNQPVEVKPPITSTSVEPKGKTNDPVVIVGNDDPVFIKKAEYNIAIIMPFNSSNFNGSEIPTDKGTRRALEFYQGSKLALNQLVSEGMNLNVFVGDSKGNESIPSLTNRPEVTNADLILGPVKRDACMAMAQMAKRNRIPMVSPYNPSATVTKDNPFYVQVNPSLSKHCYAITEHIRTNHPDANVTLVSRDLSAEMNRFSYFQEANRMIEGSNQVSPFSEFVISSGTEEDMYPNLDFSSKIKPGEKNIIVIPSWSSESFIYAVLGNLSNLTRSNEIIVYGMPQWADFEKINYDFYEMLQVHISSSNFVDMDDLNVRAFAQNFYTAYGLPPSEDAFSGYDVTLFFGRMLNEYGKEFTGFLENEKETYFHTNFEFERNLIAPYSGAVENEGNIQYFENNFLNILKFQDFYFKREN